MTYPIVDENLCIGCGVCVEVCPKNVFKVIDDVSRVMNPEFCDDCGTCIAGCSQGAIMLVEDENSLDIEPDEEQFEI